MAELRAFLKVSSCSNVKLKFLFVCLDSSAEYILSVPRVKSILPTLSDFVLRTEIYAKSIPATSTDLCEVVFGAWECSDGVVSEDDLPTVFGRTRQ